MSREVKNNSDNFPAESVTILVIKESGIKGKREHFKTGKPGHIARAPRIFLKLMSGFFSVNRYTIKMTISEHDILQTLMKSRDRIAAAAWVVVRDAHAAEDIFQNVALKALTKEVNFESEGSVLSWAFITARREGIDWLRRHRREWTGLDSEVLDLLEQDWLSEPAHNGAVRMEALRMCLKKLPEKSNRLLRLRYFESNNCREIAEQLGTELHTIYKRLSRLHKGLKECVEYRLDKSEVTES